MRTRPTPHIEGLVFRSGSGSVIHAWPEDESYVLLLDGWSQCTALGERDKAIFEEVLADNPHVSVRRT